MSKAFFRPTAWMDRPTEADLNEAAGAAADEQLGDS